MACGGGGESTQQVTGQVLEVRTRPGLQVDGFTLRAADGRSLAFEVGVIDLTAGAFPPTHLGEHQVTGQPVRVTYRADGDRLIAVRLDDG